MQQLAPESIGVASSSDCAAQLLEVTPLVMRRIRGEMRRRTMPGLSIAQFRALNYLSRHPGASLSELAEFLGLTPPSASKLVQKLVMQRVIARRVGRDRRRVRLSVTRQGRTALDVARLETRQQLAASLESLSERELAIVSAGLQIIAEAFSASDADVSVR